MNCISLFTGGAAGFDLAAEWIGWNIILQVEKDRSSLLRLQRHWPDVEKIKDVKLVNGKKYDGTVDIIFGGDPCQPHSRAGLGKGTADDRYLWPEMFRVISESNPAFVVNENVDGTITNGIVDLKINDLESAGYTCQPYCIPAEAVGALHRRDRVWIIAYDSNRIRGNRESFFVYSKEKEKRIQKRNHLQFFTEPVDLRPINANSNGKRFKKFNMSSESEDCTKRFQRYFGFGPDVRGNIPRDIIKSGVIRMLDGLPEGMDYEDRPKRIEMLGNAVVPELVYEFFYLIDYAIRNNIDLNGTGLY